MANPLQVGGAPFVLTYAPGAFSGPVQRQIADGTLPLRGGNVPGGLPFSQQLFFPEGAAQLTRPGGGTTYTANVAETVTLSEALVAKLVAKPSLAETVSNGEALATKLTAKPSPTETVTLSEALTASLVARATLSETVALAELLGVKLVAKPALAETVTLSEAIVALRRAVVGLAESVALSDSLGSTYSADVQLTATVALSEAVNAIIVGGGVALSETVALAESISVVYRARASIAETVGLSEALATKQSAKPQLAETVALDEALTAKRVTRSTVAETVTLGEALSAKRVTKPQLTEVVGLAEALATRFAGVQNLAENVALAEAIIASRRTTAGVAETVPLAELLAAGVRQTVALSETVPFAEALATKFAGSVQLAEAVALSATLTALVRSLRGANVATLPLTIGGDVRVQRPISLVHGATLVLAMLLKQSTGAAVSTGTVTLSVRKLVGDQPFFKRTVNVGAALTMLPVDTQNLPAGYYLYDLTLTQGSQTTLLVQASPFYLSQRALTLPKTYGPSAPVVVPTGTVFKDFKVSGYVLDDSVPGPYIAPDSAKTVRLQKGTTGARITVSVQQASGQFVSGGLLVFTLKKTPTGTAFVEQVLATVGVGTTFTVLPSVIAKMAAGQYLYDVWYINDGGVKTPVVPLSTFQLDPQN